MNISCLVIDDEPLARIGLAEYISNVDFLLPIASFDSALKAMDLLSKQQIDQIFLDIQMPGITGLEFVKTLPHPPLIIFTTAYPQYAVEGFSVNAIDYLLKPFSFERFLTAVNKAKTQLELQQPAAVPPPGPLHFFIKCDNKLVKINYDEVLFVEALQNYVTIHTTTKKYLSYVTFKSVEDFLPQKDFIKIHKSFIVSMSKIESIEGNEIRIGAHRLPISRTLKEEVVALILRQGYLRR
jgi:DNA-binding LytR/AlgR family response regulator